MSAAIAARALASSRLIASALQDEFAPHGICFGCGPANDKGLRLQSFVRGEKVVASFRPDVFHAAFPGVLNGGIIGSLLDCHCNWTAAWAHMRRAAPREAAVHASRRATRSSSSGRRRWTPSCALEAWVLGVAGDRATIAGTFSANGKVCATCHGTFVAVQPGHPAFHGW